MKSFKTPKRISIAPKASGKSRNRPKDSLKDSFLALQKTVGNRGVEAILRRGGFSAKLGVSLPPGPDEREAEYVAGKIISTDGPDLGTGIKDQGPSAPEATPDSGRSAFPENRLPSLPGNSQPLPAPLREFFGTALGYDFGGVRVHTDSESAGMARTLHARSFTLGRNVIFGPGQYAPETQGGKYILAHELTHVVQQGGAPPLGKSSGEPPASPRLSLLTQKNRDPGIQRSPEAFVNLEGKEEFSGVQLNPVGSNLFEVCVVGVPIARVYFADPREQRIDVHIRETSREPGKPPAVQILLDCLPTVRIELLRAGIEKLAGRGVGLQVGIRLVGIEIEWRPEGGMPYLPPRKPELIEVPPPEAMAPASASKGSEAEEARASHETTIPSPSEKGGSVEAPASEKGVSSILSDILEKLRTKIDRERIRSLLTVAAQCQLEGRECRAEMEEAAEIAVSILKRKTEALDPLSAKKETVTELLNATTDVMMLGAGEKEAEAAIAKSLRWGEAQLDLAVKELEKTPTKDKAKVVADKACAVMLLGGEPTEALDLLMKLFPQTGAKMEASPSGPGRS